ncbi:hypothetical protein BP6252_12894 [Coleophoma cylindrospora]|uniref:Uncharacterized protein n=1 Tax=Coleophoma cylindrospora TaxID=1849047 RepID=A0A3D8QDK6_9HELO|nr:hypothetical protein BP6252_12894 [Coleophoma cylindrospora]
MDETTRLVFDLQARLKDLDRKVWLYRRDMASEFTKYTEDLLRNVPNHISEAVSKAIVESMKECKSLYPPVSGDDPLVESCLEGSDANGSALASSPLPSLNTAIPPPISLAVAAPTEEDTEVPRSPHQREKEFQGVFTPSYLPLLDSTSRNERTWSADAQSPSFNKGEGMPSPNMGVDASTSTSRSLAATPEPGKPPIPKRRNTDEVSIKSNCSDGPVRRSALRRSSSFSKVSSPRRVRFEVAGQEVLPTASPVPDPIFVPDTGSSFTSFDDEEDGVSEQVEDIDIPAPPKRISSSQMLRALSREPLADDGTQWTVVCSSPSTTNQDSQDLCNHDPCKTNGKPNQSSPPKTEAPTTSQPIAVANIVSASNGAKDDDEDSSEDEVLDMKSRKSKSTQPVDTNTGGVKLNGEGENKPTQPAPILKKVSPQVTPFDKKILNGYGDLKLHDDDDALFQFDEHADEEIPAPEPLHDDDESDSEATIGDEPGVNLSEFSRSPARSIPWAGSSTTPKSPSQSYKGHPFSEPVVNEQLHASLASLGVVHSFVGSVNGRTGLDEGNMQSFRESLKYGSTGSFSGTPRSMTERMLMDDLLEAEEGRGD